MRLFLIPFIIFVSQVTLAQIPYFLSSDELHQLSEKEQISYFIEIQKILVEMTESSAFMAELGQPKRQVASPDEQDMYLMKYLDQNNLTEEQFENYHRVAVSTPLDERHTNEYREAHRIWNGFHIYFSNQVGSKKSRDWIESEKKKQLEKSEKEKKMHDEEMRIAQEKHQEWMKNYKLPPRSVILERRKKIQESNQKAKALAHQKMISDFRNSEIKSVQKSEPLCLFAGWIIEGDRCRGPFELPKDFDLPGVDRGKMKCEKNQFMCQPLLFGLRLPKGCPSFKSCAGEALPLCVGFDSSITKACQIRSFSTTKVAVELAKYQNPSLFDHYRGQFYSLCEPEMLNQNSKIQKSEKMKLDVEKTCQVAREKLQYLYQQRVHIDADSVDDLTKNSQK